MAKISSYSDIAPALTDRLIGTDVGGDPADTTKNFLLSDIRALFNLATNTLSDVLAAGNTATANIVLTGDITASGTVNATTVRTSVLQKSIAAELSINLLTPYADDATAKAGGLVANDVYVTDGGGAAPLNVAGILMIVV